MSRLVMRLADVVIVTLFAIPVLVALACAAPVIVLGHAMLRHEDQAR